MASIIKITQVLIHAGVDRKVARMFRVAPFGLPSGIIGSVFQAKGDLLVGSGVSAYNRLPGGTIPGQVPMWDPGEALGIRWGTPTTSGIPATGWNPAGVTLVYVSATSVKVVGADVAPIFRKATKVKFTQTTVKQMVVASSSYAVDTTINFIPTSDFSVANAAITDPYYSHIQNPESWADYFNYTPTVDGFSGSPTITAARWACQGKTMDVWAQISGTSDEDLFTVTVPVNAKNLAGSWQYGVVGYYTTGGGSNGPGVVQMQNNTNLMTLKPINLGAWAPTGLKNAYFRMSFEWE